MSGILTFPNLLCLVLTGVIVVHIFTQEPTMGSLPDPPDHLEDLYCRLPQSFHPQDVTVCTSAQKLFRVLGNGCSPGGRSREALQSNDTVPPADEEVLKVEATRDVKKKKDMDLETTMVPLLLIIILMFSAVVSLLEWHRAKAKLNLDLSRCSHELGAQEESARERRYSLAVLTVNRHLRRGDSTHSETTRMGSISSGTKPPPLIRRSSFPAQSPESRVRHAPQRQLSSPGIPSVRRLSMDLSEDDSSPDRRRVRFIRRH